MHNKLGDTFTRLGSMDHMRGILRAHGHAGDNPEITPAYITSYLTRVSHPPSDTLLKAYTHVLNHPFVSLLVNKCEKAQFSDFPYPLPSFTKASGL